MNNRTVFFYYMLMPLVANFVAVVTGTLLFQWVLWRDYPETQARILEHQGLLLSASFGVPTVLLWVYVWPIFSLSGQALENRQRTAKRRVLNAPLVVSGISLLGWVTSFLVAWMIIVYYSMPYDWTFALRNFVATLFSGISCFSVTYYILELVNRNRFIPAFFPDGKLSHYRGLLRLSLREKFFIYFFSVAFYPGLVLVSVVDSLLWYMEDEGVIYPGNQIAFLCFLGYVLGFGLLVTYLIARTYQQPLQEISQAAEDIRQGHLDVVVPVRTTDEIGILEEGINTMAAGLREKEMIKDTFGRVVDPQVRDHLLRGNINLGGEQKEVTVLFCDIRSFTQLSEQLSPEQVVHLLNRYFNRLSHCITQHHGLVDKYIGDAVMAVFGAPQPLSNHSDWAVKAALAMRQARDELNQELVQENMPPIENGIGIHTGMVLAGNIGSESRMEYTVIGDVVNSASRIESLCKDFHHDILISEETYKQLNPPPSVEFLSEVQVKGKARPLKIYCVNS